MRCGDIFVYENNIKRKKTLIIGLARRVSGWWGERRKFFNLKHLKLNLIKVL